MRAKVVIIGPGRMGTAVARAIRAVGARWKMLGRGQTLDPGSSVEIAFLTLRSSDFARAVANAGSAEEWYRSLGLRPDTAIVSLMADVGLAELRSQHRPVARFLATTALAQNGSLRVVDESSDPEAVAVAKALLPGNWVTVSTDSYETAAAVLVTAAVAIKAANEYLASLPLEPDLWSALLPTIWAESLLLLSEHGWDLDKVWEQSRTPGGLCDALQIEVIQP